MNYEFPPLGGGAGDATKTMARALVSRGLTVDVVTMGARGLKPQEIVDGVSVYRVKSLRKKKETAETIEMISFVLAAIPVVLKLTKKNKYDLVHSHFIIPTSILAYILKKIRKLPYLVTVHGSDVPGYNPDRFTFEHLFSRPFLKLIVKDAAVVIPLSDYLKGLIERNISSRCKLKVLSNGIDPNRFSTAAVKNNWLLLSGRHLKRKGFQYLFKAAESLELKGWEIHVAGDGPYRANLVEAAKSVKVKVVFHGWLDKNSTELKTLYEKSKIFVMPSKAENSPISLLEAMNAALAIITANTTGCKEAVGDTALLVSPEDPDQIKECVSRLVQDQALIERLSLAARQRAREKFSLDQVIDSYLEIYKRIAVNQESRD